MAEKRTLDEEVVNQCCDFFAREHAHWTRLNVKKISITEEEFQAKKEIIEAVFRVAAAAVTRINQQMWTETLKFSHRGLEMEMQLYRRFRNL